MAVIPFDTVLRSFDTCWNRQRWEKLPYDGNRYEVIDGVLYMSTSPSLFHQWISRRILFLLAAQVDDRGRGTTLYAPVGVFMPNCQPVAPDLFVVLTKDRAIMRDGSVEGVPALIVEILSPSHLELDLRTKREAYARAGVPEYWIVRPATRDVLVCCKPDASLGDFAQANLVPADGVLQSPTLPFEATVAGFFAGAPDTTL